MDPMWKWIPCTNCSLRGQFIKPTEFREGQPIYTKDGWTCIHCEEKQQPQMINTLPFYGENVYDSTINSEIIDATDLGFQYVPKLPNGLLYAHININGIQSKFEEVKQLVAFENNIMLLAITETKLNSDRHSCNMFSVQNYNMIRRDREMKEGGGTIIYVHSSCEYELIEWQGPIPTLIECTIVKINHVGVKPITCCTLYIPPDRVNEQLFEFFEKLCEFLASIKGDTVIFGDMNINLNVKTSDFRKILSISKEFNYKQMISFPTRLGLRKFGNEIVRTDTLIDHLYVNSESLFEVGGCEFAGSDHKLIYAKKGESEKNTTYTNRN